MLHSMLPREGGEHFRDRREQMSQESEREVAGIKRLSEEKEEKLEERNRDFEETEEEEPNEKRRKKEEPVQELVEKSTKLDRVDSLEVNEEEFSSLFPFFNALPKTVQEDVAKMLTNKDRRALSQTCVQMRGLLWDQNSKFLDCRIRSPLFAVFLADTVWLSKKGLIPQRENVFATDGEVMNQGFLDLVDIIRTTTEATPSVTVRVERLSPSQVAYLKHMMLNLENLVVSIRWEFLSGILDEMLIFLLNECTSEVHLRSAPHHHQIDQGGSSREDREAEDRRPGDHRTAGREKNARCLRFHSVSPQWTAFQERGQDKGYLYSAVVICLHSFHLIVSFHLSLHLSLSLFVSLSVSIVLSLHLFYLHASALSLSLSLSLSFSLYSRSLSLRLSISLSPYLHPPFLSLHLSLSF